MAQPLLDAILDQLDTLQTEELHRLEDAIRARLAEQESVRKRTAFHRALLASGLIKQIAPQRDRGEVERRGIPVQGRPVSATLLEERR